MSSSFQVHVLIRCSKKTGKIDKVITALGRAMLDMWALQHTTSSKQCFILNRETGEIVYATEGQSNSLPKVKDYKKCGYIGNCEDLGITFEELQELGYDERFDKKEEE